MKSAFRTLAAVAVAAVLTFPLAPIAAASPCDGNDDLTSRIVHVVKKLQKLFGITSQTNEPIPPRP